MANEKLIGLKDIKRLIKSRKKLPVVNSELKRHLKNAVNNMIKKSMRKEAFEILNKSSKERIGEFLYYYHSDSGVACLVLDTAKDELVKQRKMKKGEKGKETFGGIKY